MISKYYPNTENSLANAISICTRAWYEHDSKSICESGNKEPIATYFATELCGDILIGEVYKNGEFRCPQLDKYSCMCIWVPLIFYETISPILVDSIYLDLYIRIYNKIMRKSVSGNIGLLNIKTNECVKIIDVVEARRSLLCGKIGKCLRKKDPKNEFSEFSYLFQDVYIDRLSKCVEYTTEKYTPVKTIPEIFNTDNINLNDEFWQILLNLAYPYIGTEDEVSISATTLEDKLLSEKLTRKRKSKEIKTTIRNKYGIELPSEVISDCSLDERIIDCAPSGQFPENPYPGMHFYNQYDELLYIYDGAQWDHIIKPRSLKPITIDHS